MMIDKNNQGNKKVARLKAKDAIIEELRERLERLEEFIASEIALGQAKDRERIAKLEATVFEEPKQPRRNFEAMAIKLRERLKTQRRGMDYKHIKEAFNLRANMEAVRLMEKAAEIFTDVEIVTSGNSRKRKLVVFKKGG